MSLLTNRELKATILLIPFLAIGGYIAWRASFPPLMPTATTIQEEKDTASANDSIVLFNFDPNTVELFDLCRMGFSRNQAASIIKYRERGKIFEIPEDFATCYAVNESIYLALRPYIHIGQEFALKRFEQKPQYPERTSTPKPIAERFVFMPDTASIATFKRLGFSQKQAENIIKYRAMIGGYHSAEEFEKCYMVSAEIAEQLRPYAVYDTTVVEKSFEELFPIDLNTADSATLCKIVGIGPKSASAIIAYREKLGGFYKVEQLAEIPQVTEQNYYRILPQIWIDTCKIKKININFAPAKELLGHPYITDLQIRKLLKERQLKGGWCSQQDFSDDKILNTQEMARFAPYLIFRYENQ